MFIDTHCHLADFENLDTVITNAGEANVDVLIYAGADIRDIKHQIETVEKYKNIFCTIGIHPEYADSYLIFHISDIKNICDNTKVIGIGEIGLDYNYGTDNKNKQIELFEKQIQIAIDTNLPIAIHTRDAESDTINILDGSCRGVMHCFTGSWEFAKQMLDRGFYFSASGILTFKNADELRETFAKIPNDRIVIETDSPYCAPVPYRGKQCEPAMVIETAKVLAQIKNLQLSDLESILEQNTKQLYPKLKW